VTSSHAPRPIAPGGHGEAAPRRRPSSPLRRIWLLALALTLAGVTPAQDAPVEAATATLDDLLAAAQGRTGVVTAILDLDEARAALIRTEADPLALRLELTRARQAVELAEAEADAARLEAVAEVAGAWAQVREAELQVALAAAARELAERAVEIARLRLERGSATRLDVEEAITQLGDADKNLATARDGMALARSNLTGLTGHPGPFALEPVPRERLERPLPDDAVFVAALDGLPPVLQLTQAIELATLGVELLDPSFASRAQIEGARTQLAQAEAGATEARRALTLRTRSLLNAVATARETDRIGRDALAQAHERESIEARRFDAGLIAEIALQQTRLGTGQAELRAVQGEHGLMRALLDLQAGTLVALEGWDAR
jgi:outer membrane protein, heavy metal efflux system